MKLLLTSIGLSNDSIRQALVELVGKPTSEAKAVCIPTAVYGLPNGVNDSWALLHELYKIGWQEYGVLELTALPTVLESDWLPTLEEADVIIVGGGNTGYLSYWMETSGMFDRLPKLLENKVYMGISAGGAMVTHSINYNKDVLAKTGQYYDDEYDEYAPMNAGLGKTLQLVDFVIRPHLNADYFPDATTENFAKAASKIDVPLYAFDDQSAIKVVDGQIEVVSEGEWTVFNQKSS